MIDTRVVKKAMIESSIDVVFWSTALNAVKFSLCLKIERRIIFVNFIKAEIKHFINLII